MKTAKPTKLSLVEMRQIVLQEMDHIPKWPKDHQSDLRMEYWFWRMNSLGKKPSVANDRAAVLKKCLESMAKNHPGVEFQYDKTFFRVSPQG